MRKGEHYITRNYVIYALFLYSSGHLMQEVTVFCCFPHGLNIVLILIQREPVSQRFLRSKKLGDLVLRCRYTAQVPWRVTMIKTCLRFPSFSIRFTTCTREINSNLSEVSWLYFVFHSRQENILTYKRCFRMAVSSQSHFCERNGIKKTR